MNYPTFLKKVDAATLECDKEALSAIIHELARTFPEREEGLVALRSFGFLSIPERTFQKAA